MNLNKKFFLVIILNLIFFEKIFSKTLDELALIYGTDKSSKLHGYTKYYEDIFYKFKDKPINFLEIGFFKGESARMWQDYFSKATLHFIDNDTNSFSKYGKGLDSRTYLSIVDQSNKEQLLNFINKSNLQFDIIIDDGSHIMSHQILTFETLFPFLSSGGIYVIEDLHTSYWKEYGGYGDRVNPKEGPGTAINYLHSLIDDLNIVSSKYWWANIERLTDNEFEKLTFLQKNIKSISFYSGLVFIFKR